MTNDYLSKDRKHLAAMQRQRRARMVRIDYMPSKAARDAIESMRAVSRPGSVSATNSAVIDAIVAEWARLTGLKKTEVEQPRSSKNRPELGHQNARARVSPGNSAKCASVRVGITSAAPEYLPAPRERAGANDFGRCSTGTEARQARVICGAKRRRDGQACQALSVPGKQRCKWHGGCSTGPRTDEGRARSILNLRQYQSHSPCESLTADS